MSDAAATLGHRVRVMEGLLKVDDYAGVATAAEAALGDLSVLSNVALMRGKALLNILLKKLMNGDDEDETSDEQTDVLREPLVMILLALSLDPESAAAKSEAETLRDLFPILGMKVPADLEEDLTQHLEGSKNSSESGEDSFIYRARRPFHPRRLHAWMTEKMGLCVRPAGDGGSAEYEEEEEEEEEGGGGAAAAASMQDDEAQAKEEEEDSDPWADLVEKRAQAAREHGQVLRSMGCVWLATWPWNVGEWHQAGPMASIGPTFPWAVTVPAEDWPKDAEAVADIWENFTPAERFIDLETVDPITAIGDRRQELKFTGLGLDEAKLTATLNECLLTDEEMEKNSAWCEALKTAAQMGEEMEPEHPFNADDPFAEWDFDTAGGGDGEDDFSEPDEDEPYDVIIVGAGASGVGVGLMLTKVFGLNPKRVQLIERGEKVGETFRQWPKEMRFISPSFNQQGWTGTFDLNSVFYGTSPAFTLHQEHPTGEQYARYLCAVADAAHLNVRANTEVTAVRSLDGDGFEVDVVPAGSPAGTAPTPLQCKYVVWAAGEFQYPRAKTSPMFPGSELCLHNSSVRSWAEMPGDDFVVIGGYESGMDAASNLASCGKRCTVVSSTAYWNKWTEDPSTELAPYTSERVRAACETATPPRLLAPLRVYKVEALVTGSGPAAEKKRKTSTPTAAAAEDGGYLVHARWGPTPKDDPLPFRVPLQSAEAAMESASPEGTEVTLRTPQPPVLCAGFEGSIAVGVVKDLFEWGKTAEEGGGDGCMAGSPLLSKVDGSTKTPGLFLCGPAVRHGDLSFCFVYKFRQRFGIVADAIARGLGRDTTKTVADARKMNMFLDDFTCCKAACGESC